MNRAMILPLLFGLVGAAILAALCIWQVQRLAWKEGVLAEINARISAAPIPVPNQVDEARDKYLPVTFQGNLTGQELRVLASIKQVGAVYRVVSVLDTGAGRVLVDRGHIPVQGGGDTAVTGQVEGIGNLHWPDEIDSFTPEPDLSTGLWFARDLPAMAAHLDSKPILIIARQMTQTDPPVTPLPLSAEGIPNNHLQYAITWFLLCLVWLGMTAFLLWRIRSRSA